jgi:hypothetical protein
MTKVEGKNRQNELFTGVFQIRRILKDIKTTLSI